ncbi:PqqD family protein [Aurantiacibacter flavus]|uniref:PqqD family protein n=1 Tax=Aurantiacibacter flavus TaxID=3145232 RepID=A0ABV0CZB6_9SPHN
MKSGGSRAKYRRCEDLVVCDLDGGSALLDLNTSTYFKLNSTASFIWEKLGDGPMSADMLADELIQVYDVEKAVCLPDIQDVLEDLARAKLVTGQS